MLSSSAPLITISGLIGSWSSAAAIWFAWKSLKLSRSRLAGSCVKHRDARW
jgi:hypothetical protein